MPRTLLALVDLTLLQRSLVRELLAGHSAVEIQDVEPGELELREPDAVIASARALGRREVFELLTRRPAAKALVMRGDLRDASLYFLNPHVEHFEQLSKSVLERLVAPRSCPDWNP